jgi:hypothetical protein
MVLSRVGVQDPPGLAFGGRCISSQQHRNQEARFSISKQCSKSIVAADSLQTPFRVRDEGFNQIVADDLSLLPSCVCRRTFWWRIPNHFVNIQQTAKV